MINLVKEHPIVVLIFRSKKVLLCKTININIKMCRCLVKYYLFCSNLLFAIIGLILLGLGVTAYYMLGDYIDEELALQIEFLPHTLIGLGAIVFIITFSGCCGAITETSFLLIIYSIFMVFLALIKVYATVTLSLNLTTYENDVKSFVNEAFEDPQYNITIHGLEVLIKCCGTSGPSYYENKLPKLNGSQILPPTCCKDPTDTSTFCFEDKAFEIGCTDVLGEFFTSIANTFGIVMIALIVYEVMVTVFSVCIMKTIKSKEVFTI